MSHSHLDPRYAVKWQAETGELPPLTEEGLKAKEWEDQYEALAKANHGRTVTLSILYDANFTPEQAVIIMALLAGNPSGAIIQKIATNPIY